MPIIDGKRVAAEVCTRLATETERIRMNHQVQPGLAVVIIGDDPASKIYVATKVKKARELQIHSVNFTLPASTSQVEVLELIARLNNDPLFHGILVQSPPPPGINERAIIDVLHPAKDVDCFTPHNLGKLILGDEDGFIPCTPGGIMALLRHTQIETEGKHAVILGRSNIVGKPMAMLLARKSKSANATVTLCHSRSQHLAEITRTADILIAAMGQPESVTANMVKEGAVVIDVGISRRDDPEAHKGYRVVGDVDFAQVEPLASHITPVPGGVGPMTIATLMYNTVKACCQQHQLPPPGPLF